MECTRIWLRIRLLEFWPARDFGFRGDTYITKKFRVVSLARDTPTRLLVLLFIPTKYYQNMSKGIKVMERTRMSMDFSFREDNYIRKKVKVVSLARNTPIRPPLYFRQILWNYHKQYGCYGLQKILTRGDNYITKIVRVDSLARDTPTVLLFIPTKYYQNMSKGIKVMERTRMPSWSLYPSNLSVGDKKCA